MSNITPQVQKTTIRRKRSTDTRPVLSQQSTNTIPDGYMTSEEFWKKVEEDIDKICQKYGIL